MERYIEDDFNPKKRNRRPRKRPRWPFIILGFVVGFITLPAVIALAVLLIVYRPVENTVNTIDKFTNVGLYEILFGSDGEDGKVGILDERYGDMQLKDMISDIASVAGKGNQLTFTDLAHVSPQVEKAVDELLLAAEEKGIVLDKTELMTTPLEGMSDMLMDEVEEIRLGEVLMSLEPEMFEGETGDILKNLFFGKAEVNYTDYYGTVEMLPLTYTYDDETDVFICIDGTTLISKGQYWASEDGDYIVDASVNYEYYSAYGELLYRLQLTESKDIPTYVAVTTDNEIVKQSSLTVGALMGGSDIMDVFGKLELGVLLGVHLEENATEDNAAMLVALAYGTYGVDYTFEHGKVVPVAGGKPFTTIGSLMESPEDVLNGMQLGSLLGISTKTDAEKSGNEMLVALAYGTYGVDYKYDTNGNIIPVDGGKPFTTLNDLINNSDELLNGMQLGSLLGITDKTDAENKDNAMLVALAYGTYGIDFDYGADDRIVPVDGGKPFTTLGDLINSPNEVLDGVQLGALFGITTKTDAENKDNAMLVALAYGTFGTDFDYDDNDNIIPVDGGKPFTTLGDLLNDPNDVLNDVQLGSLLGISTKTDVEKEGNEMLVALAYGTYGVDFDYDIHGNVVPIGGQPFTTLGDLINSPDDVLNDVRLGSLLGITTKTDAENKDNAMIVALAYGTFGVDFDYDNSGNIIPVDGGKPFTTLGDLINNPNDVLNEVQLGSLFGITTKTDAEDEENAMIVALAYGTYGTDFDYDDNGNIIPIEGGKPFTTLGDLIESPNDVLNGVQLGSLFGITTQTDAEAEGNEMLVALSYGTFGVDYEYDKTGKIIPIEGGRAFTTLGQLIDNPNDVLNGVQLGTLLGISTKTDAEKDENSMMVSIAYGTYGIDYEYDDNGNIIPIEGGKPFTTLGDLINDSDKVLNGVHLGSLLGIKTKEDAEKEGNEMLVALAYGTYGVDYEYDDAGVIVQIPTGKSFTTLGELIDSPDAVLDGVRLGALLGVTTKDDVIVGENDMTVALAYGTYGEDFTYDDNGTIVPIEGGRPFTTLGDLMDDPETVLQDMQVGTLLGITDKESAESSDSLMVSLAYGTYGVDYEYDETGKIVPVEGGKPFTTVATLTDPDEVNKIMNDIPLSSIFTVDVFDENADALTVSLVYGTEGKHYVIAEKDGEKYIDWLTNEDTGEKYHERTFGELREGKLTDLVNDLRVGDVFEVTASSPKLLHAIENWYVSDLSKQEKLDSLLLKDVINVGTDGVLAEMGEWKIGEINENKVKTLKLSSVLSVKDGETGMLATLANKTNAAGEPWTIADLTEENIKTLTLAEVIEIDENDAFLSAMGGWKIGEIDEDKVKTIQLSSVLSVKEGETGLIASLANKKDKDGNPWTIADLTDENVKTLTLGEVLPDAMGADADTDFFAALRNTPIGELDSQYIKDTLTIGQVLGIKETDEGILATFANYKVGEFTEDALKEKLTIGDVLDTSAHPILEKLSAKTLDSIDKTAIEDALDSLTLKEVLDTSVHPVLAKLENTTIGNLNNQAIKDALNDLVLSDVIEIDHPLFNYMSNKKLGEIDADFIDDISVKDALGITTTDDPILTQIMDMKLGELKDSTLLKNKITNLELGQLMDVSGIPVLEQLGNYQLNELDEETINGLKICEILGIENPEDDFYFKHLQNSTIETMVSDIDNLTVMQLFEDSIEYDADGNLKGTWKYLLTHNPDVDDGDDSNNPAPEDYKVTDMSLLIENMHNNIETATLQSLHDDGIIPHLGDGADTLHTPLLPDSLASQESAIKAALGLPDSTDLSTMTIGSLTVLQAADYLTYLLNAMSMPSLPIS